MFLLVLSLSIVWGLVSLAAILFPFTPFKTRKQALISTVVAIFVVLFSPILLVFFENNDSKQLASVEKTATPVVEKTATPVVEKTATPAIRILVSDDFTWDSDTSPFKDRIVAVVNKIKREGYYNCPKPDASSVMQSPSHSKPNDPVFFVMCGDGWDVFNIWFKPNGQIYRKKDF